MPHASSTFVIDKKDFVPAEWVGGSMTRGRFEKTFTGDFEGTGVVEAVLLRSDGDGPAVYSAVERIDGTLHGKRGSFLLLHQAMMPGPSSWSIAQGSGLGELQGISGAGEITPGHAFTLDYEL